MVRNKKIVGFNDISLKIIGIDLLLGKEIWTYEPSIAQASVISYGSNTCVNECDSIVFSKIVTLHSSPIEAHVSLLVSLRSGMTYAWNIDATSGHILSSPTTFSSHSIKENLDIDRMNDKTNKQKVLGPLFSVMALVRDVDGHKGNFRYMLVRYIYYLLNRYACKSIDASIHVM